MPNQQTNLEQQNIENKIQVTNWKDDKMFRVLGIVLLGLLLLNLINAFLPFLTICPELLFESRGFLLEQIIPVILLMILIIINIFFVSRRIKRLGRIDKIIAVTNMVLIVFFALMFLRSWGLIENAIFNKISPSCSVTETNITNQTANWQIYRNVEYGFEVKYPKDWIAREASAEEAKYGEVVLLDSPATEELIKDNKIVMYKDIEISFWKNINDNISGTYPGQPKYSGLDDFLSDKNNIIQKIGETNIDGYKAYEVEIGGAGDNYGIMIEYSGIYQIRFGRTAVDQRRLPSNIEDQILSTFEFIE